MKCTKSTREICPNYSNGTKRKVHHIRITNLCIYERDGECVRLGDACELPKAKRMRGR